MFGLYKSNTILVKLSSVVDNVIGRIVEPRELLYFIMPENSDNLRIIDSRNQ